MERPVRVHLLPALALPGELAGGVAVVIDVLRATTTIVHALAAGCVAVVPCGEIEEAKAAGGHAVGRQGAARRRARRQADARLRPGQFARASTPPRCARSATVVLTTTNGTRALLRAAEAERVLVAAFVNYSAVCEQLRAGCASCSYRLRGTEGAVLWKTRCWPGRWSISCARRQRGAAERRAPGWRGTASRTTAGCCPGRWRSARAGPTSQLWAMMTTSARRPRWTGSPWCRSCAATRCGSRRRGRSGSSKVIGRGDGGRDDARRWTWKSWSSLCRGAGSSSSRARSTAASTASGTTARSASS